MSTCPSERSPAELGSLAIPSASICAATLCNLNLHSAPSPPSSTPSPASCQAGCVQKSTALASSGARSSRCFWTCRRWATPAPTTESLPLPEYGRLSVMRWSRHQGEAFLCPWSSALEKPSSLIGARIELSSRVYAPSCKWLTSSSATAEPSICGPIPCKPMRCCSMLTTVPLRCLEASLGGGSTTTCAQPSIVSAVASSERSTPASVL
ncbi:hypothetical protein CtCNB1_1545 [Comamonas thiooxydans]|nr:hypothetical protein CtCNB1_1545 [Comamonas thiooxydans]